MAHGQRNRIQEEYMNRLRTQEKEPEIVEFMHKHRIQIMECQTAEGKKAKEYFLSSPDLEQDSIKKRPTV